MRRFIIFSICLFLSACYIGTFVGVDNRPFVDKLEEAINTCDMKTYENKDLEYTVTYPSFFEQTPDSMIDEFGYSEFHYWDNWVQIRIQTYIINNQDDKGIAKSKNAMAKKMHVKVKSYGKDYFILSGPLYSDGIEIEGQRVYAKFIKKQKLWFVSSLTYPEEYTSALHRLFIQIDKWNIHDKKKNIEEPIFLR